MTGPTLFGQVYKVEKLRRHNLKFETLEELKRNLQLQSFLLETATILHGLSREY
jgi:hypothetical protein